MYYSTKYLISSAHFQLEYWNSTYCLSKNKCRVFFESFGVTLLIKLCMTLTDVIERKKQAKLFCVLCSALTDVIKIKKKKQSKLFCMLFFKNEFIHFLLRFCIHLICFFDVFCPWCSVIKETRISKLARRFSQRKEKINIR